jgi:hypothetical protein
MPTDLVRGLKAHGTCPAKTKLGALLSVWGREMFPGQPYAQAETRGQGLSANFSWARR